MTVTDDRPTLPERYARAIESTHLEVKPERGSVDYLIAAGWVRDGLGTLLYRVRAEYDAVRAEQRLAERNLKAAEAFATVRRGDDAMQQAAKAVMQQAAEDAALTARALILVHLKTLAPAKDALGQFAVLWATRSKYMQPDGVVGKIAGRALDAWLDPLCPHCEGRGFNGGSGSPMVLCAPCGGTRLRAVRLSPDEPGHQFGRSLLNEMDRKTDYVTGQMRRFLAQGG